mmetsp:Transcript_43173/g.50528  ORF Transcript_43173/g.50528 Transcript_43173/m.50528 type:complete len:330 (-) Transcript_43173:44-1033(-)
MNDIPIPQQSWRYKKGKRNIQKKGAVRKKGECIQDEDFVSSEKRHSNNTVGDAPKTFTKSSKYDVQSSKNTSKGISKRNNSSSSQPLYSTSYGPSLVDALLQIDDLQQPLLSSLVQKFCILGDSGLSTSNDVSIKKRAVRCLILKNLLRFMEWHRSTNVVQKERRIANAESCVSELLSRYIKSYTCCDALRTEVFSYFGLDIFSGRRIVSSLVFGGKRNNTVRQGKTPVSKRTGNCENKNTKRKQIERSAPISRDANIQSQSYDSSYESSSSEDEKDDENLSFSSASFSPEKGNERGRNLQSRRTNLRKVPKVLMQRKRRKCDSSKEYK